MRKCKQIEIKLYMCLSNQLTTQLSADLKNKIKSKLIQGLWGNLSHLRGDLAEMKEVYDKI